MGKVMLREIECIYCDTKFSFENFGNIGVICPHCRRVVKIECDCGFGPVTPCRIYLGEKIVGVVESEYNKYHLRKDGKTIPLKEMYMKAIQEALNIVNSQLTDETIPISEQKSLIENNHFEFNHVSSPQKVDISIKTGHLRLYTEWIGNPYDRPVKIIHTNYDGEILEIIFKHGQLLVYNPQNITSNEMELRIEKARKLKWIYVPYGTMGDTVITYISEDRKLIKSSKSGTEYLTSKDSFDAVYLGEWKWDE